MPGRGVVFRSLARSEVDLGGGGSLGDDFGVAAELVFHGGGEEYKQILCLADQGGDAGGVADEVDLVFLLRFALAVDECEVCPEIGDEAGVDGIGDESGNRGGGFELLEDAPGIGEDLAVGVIAEAVGGGEAGFLFPDGGGGGGDGLKVVADFPEEVGLGSGGGACGTA